MINPQLNHYRFIRSIIIGASLSMVSSQPSLALNLGKIASLAYEITECRSL